MSSVNISYLQATQAVAATESAQTAKEVGGGQVQRASKQRKQLQKSVKELQAKSEKLQAELKDVSDRGWFESTISWLGGGDDAGDIGAKLERNGAALEKASKEIQVAQAQIDQALGELQAAQQDLGSRVNKHKKAFEEAERTQAMALA